MNKKNSSGFTLIELLIYTAIFASVAGLLTSILVTTTKVSTNQTVTTQVTNELNLLLSTVQTQVRSSSNIECVGADQGTCSTSTTSGPYLKLRFENPTIDPTCIYLSGTQILMAQGPDSTNNQNCTSTTQALTTNKVNATSLTFTKFDIPGGHATVQIDATIAYNSTSPDMQISRSLHSAIGRVSAATFDSDLLPDLTNSRSIGSTIGSKVWKNLFLTGALGLGTATDAQETGVTTTTGALYFNTTGNTVKVYNGASWQNISQWTTSGSNIYYNTGNVGIGVATPAAKLDVAGGVKLANDTATCDSTKAGTIRWSGTNFEACTGIAWTNFVNVFSATGGTITTIGGYTIHTFTTSGTFTPNSSGNVEYLVVAGGGGGSSGGGGAGGFRTATGFAVTAQAYNVTVGGGGAGNGVSINGSSGGDSVFSTITSNGGGGGGKNDQSVNPSGGSGGGGGATSSVQGSGGAGNTPSTSPSQGNNGGTVTSTFFPAPYPAAGGGGAGAIGGNPTGASIAGNGGNGTASSISGSSVTYAGGGGGAVYNGGTGGTGGSGGGGAGGTSGTAGTVNTGGGGGGTQSSGTGGAGGSGIVIIRYTR